MRIWDLEPACLCRSHLLGEHRELHAVWSILTQDKRGYRAHPETRRWEGKLAALYRRHEALVAEMTQRTPLGRYGQPDEIAGAGAARMSAFANDPCRRTTVSPSPPTS